MRSSSLAVMLAALALLGVAGPEARATTPLKVVASFSVIADFARNVGGDRVAVATLVGPGVDAHTYEPKPADAASLAGADLVLVNGLGLEGFLARLVAASGTKAPVVTVSEGVAPLKPSRHEHARGSAEPQEVDAEDGAPVDPHAWQSIPNAALYVGNIADAFCAADAAGCETYRANAAAYLDKLKALDKEIRRAMAAIPPERRLVITSHDAFGYFEHEYDIEFLAPEGVSTEAEASAADIAALIRQIRDEKVSAVFVENVTNPKLIDRIAAETGIKAGGQLYSDALPRPDSTYLQMMRHNAETIRAALMAG